MSTVDTSFTRTDKQLIATLVQKYPDGLPEEQKKLLIDKPHLVAEVLEGLRFARLQEPKPMVGGFRIVKTTPVIIGGGRTTDMMVKNAKVTCTVDGDIKDKNMRSGGGRERQVIIEWGEFDHEPLTPEIWDRCEEPECGYGTYEDGLRFREQNPEAQKERPHIIIPENPWCDSGDYPYALHLWLRDGGLEVGLGNDRPGLRWYRRCLFGRRKYLVSA